MKNDEIKIGIDPMFCDDTSTSTHGPTVCWESVRSMATDWQTDRPFCSVSRLPTKTGHAFEWQTGFTLLQWRSIPCHFIPPCWYTEDLHSSPLYSTNSERVTCKGNPDYRVCTSVGTSEVHRTLREADALFFERERGTTALSGGRAQWHLGAAIWVREL